MSAINDDRLSGEVALTAAIEGKGLKIAGRSRFLTAADRMLGHLVDLPGSYIEELRNRVLLKQKSKTLQLEATEARKLGEAIGLPALQRLGLENLVREGARRQENREAVWVQAEEALKSLPDLQEIDPDNDDADTLDEDWLNIFSRHADEASSERVQEMWGRILAGEIRKPRSFSLSTLRVISELDGDIASAFQEICKYRFRDNLCREFIGDTRRGKILTQLSLLENAGLVQEVGGHRQILGKPNKDNKNNVCLFGDEYGLEFGPASSETNIDVVPLTRAGYQISLILPNNEREVFEFIASKNNHFEEINLFKIISRRQDSFSVDIINKIKTPDEMEGGGQPSESGGESG